MNRFVNLIVCVAAVVSISACDNKVGEVRTRVVVNSECDESTTEKRAAFTLQCIANANPKSDEEPEDWVWLCHRMAEQTYCPEIKYQVFERCIRASSSWPRNCWDWIEQSRRKL